MARNPDKDGCEGDYISLFWRQFRAFTTAGVGALTQQSRFVVNPAPSS